MVKTKLQADPFRVKRLLDQKDGPTINIDRKTQGQVGKTSNKSMDYGLKGGGSFKPARRPESCLKKNMCAGECRGEGWKKRIKKNTHTNNLRER